MDLPIPLPPPTHHGVHHARNAGTAKSGGDAQPITSQAQSERREAYRCVSGSERWEEGEGFGGDGWEAQELGGACWVRGWLVGGSADEAGGSGRTASSVDDGVDALRAH